MPITSTLSGTIYEDRQRKRCISNKVLFVFQSLLTLGTLHDSTFCRSQSIVCLFFSQKEIIFIGLINSVNYIGNSFIRSQSSLYLQITLGRQFLIVQVQLSINDFLFSNAIFSLGSSSSILKYLFKSNLILVPKFLIFIDGLQEGSF